MSNPASFGDCVVQSEQDPLHGRRLRVLQADPQVLVAPEVLDEVAANPPGFPATFDGEFLRIQGTNRKVIYRIGEYLPDRRAYVAEWPD